MAAVLAPPGAARAPPSPSSPSRLTAAPTLLINLGTQQHPSSPPRPGRPGSQSLGQGEVVYLRALLWVFSGVGCVGTLNRAVSLSLSQVSFRVCHAWVLLQAPKGLCASSCRRRDLETTKTK